MKRIPISFLDTGQKFGKLKPIEGLEPTHAPQAKNLFNRYKCLCECGEYITILTSQLIRGTQSCGCLRISSNITDELRPNMTINRFTVIEYSYEENAWKVQCSCPNKTICFVGGKQLLNDNTQSCGCLMRENSKQKAIDLINKKSGDPIIAVARKIYKTRYSDGDITLDAFMELAAKPCFYCNAEKTNAQTKKPSQYSELSKLSHEELTYRYNGLDRIDSSRRHFLNNCVPSCMICNHAKSDNDQELFIRYLRKLANHKIEISFNDYRQLANNIDTSFFEIKEHFSICKSIRYLYTNRYDDADFSIQTFYQLSQLNCYYCGSEKLNLFNRAKHKKATSTFAKSTGDFLYNGLDRIDPTLPHTYNNVIPCCRHCNFAKNDLTIDEWFAWIDRLRIKWATI